MKLENLSVVEGSRKLRNRVGRVHHLVMVKQVEKVIKAKKQEVDIQEKQDLKVDNYHYIEDFLKEDLVTRTLRLSMQ